MSKPVCLITGTTHGIGLATARALALDGYQLVMGCRNAERANAVRLMLVDETGNPDIQVLDCDLANLDSVRSAVIRFQQQFQHLDLLINNAGTMVTRFQTTQDGLELTFVANYLGPWLLTRGLLDSLVAAGSARIVTVASTVHRRGRLDLGTLGNDSGRRFSGMDAYARSKLGNVMATLTQAELLENTGVTANCLHPGVVASNITAETNLFLKLGMKLAAPFMFSLERGAATSLFLARDEGVGQISGHYFDQNQEIAEPAAQALSKAERSALWNWSSRFCNVPEVWRPGAL